MLKNGDIFYSGALSSGGFFTGYFPTEYKFIDEVVKGNRTKLCYYLNLGFSHVAAVVSAVVAKTYYTMNLKATAISTIIIVRIGNMLYSLR